MKSEALWSIDSDVAAICLRIVLLLGIKLFFKTGVREHKHPVNVYDGAVKSVNRAMSVIYCGKL